MFLFGNPLLRYPTLPTGRSCFVTRRRHSGREKSVLSAPALCVAPPCNWNIRIRGCGQAAKQTIDGSSNSYKLQDVRICWYCPSLMGKVGRKTLRGDITEGSRPLRVVPVFPYYRQQNSKSGSLLRNTFHVNRAIMAFHNTFYNGEPQPCTCHITSLLVF